jgi:Tat protein translocase TatC
LTQDAKMSFLEHLEELRRRLIICAASVFAGMIICWFFREQILAFLLDPLYHAWSQVDGLDEPRPLNFSSMLEPFIAYLKLSAIGGLFLAAPVVLYQLWRFVSPGLYPKEKKFALPFVLVSTVLFVGGSTMAYSMVFPIGFRFFLEFAAGQKMTTVEATVTIRGEPEIVPEKQPPPRAVKAVEEEEAEDMMDAGVDASVPKPSDPEPDAAEAPPGPTMQKSPRSAVIESSEVSSEADQGDPQRAESPWYETLFGMLAPPDCAELEVAPSLDAKRAVLTVRWHEMRCGEPKPEQLVVRRDDEKIMATWRSALSREPGVRAITTDDPAPPGPHRYALRFPTNPNAHRLAPMLMVKDYLSFAIRLILAFGLIFELPIFISFLAVAGIVDYKQLIRFFRYFFVIAVIVGAVLTPPDVVTQLLLALPLMLLYGLSIGVAYLFGERPRE